MSRGGAEATRARRQRRAAREQLRYERSALRAELGEWQVKIDRGRNGDLDKLEDLRVFSHGREITDEKQRAMIVTMVRRWNAINDILGEGGTE